MPGLEDLTTDQLLAHAKELEQRSAFFAQLTSDPKTRPMIQEAIKAKFPQVSIPELDAKREVLGKVDEQGKEIEKLRNQILERDVRERLEKEKSGVMERYKLSLEDMKGVEALMIQSDTNPNPIPSYDAAARVFRASRESAVPTPASFAPPTYEMPEKDVWGKGIGNKAMLDKIGLNEMFKAFNEVRSGKVAA
jgi:hypothetical protein